MEQRIPRSISDIDASWIEWTLRKIIGSEEGDLSISGVHLNTFKCNEELFECCNVSFYSSQQDKTRHWLIKLVPSDQDLREIVLKHDLFKKELRFYQEVIPALTAFVASSKSNIRLPFPNFVCGEYDDDSNYGVIVLEDLYSSGHSLDDTELQRISNQIRIENVIQRLAEFHATSAAYERSTTESLEEKFPFLKSDSPGGSLWFSSDMQAYLEEMYDTCLKFLQAIPGQEETSQWFEQRMKDPKSLQHSGNSLKTLIHGDLWHNNIYFGKFPEERKVILSGWQMAHFGSAANDLCFFLCSSTTSAFRRENWDKVVRFYYDKFTDAFNKLITATTESNERLPVPDFPDFLLDVKASIPVSLFFCANLRDLDHEQSQQSQQQPSPRIQVDDFGSNEDGLERLYLGEAGKSVSLKDLHGSFNKLTTSYSLFLLEDPDSQNEMEVIQENNSDELSDDSDEEEEEEEEAGIIISFGAASSNSLQNTRLDLANVKAQRQQQAYKRTKSDCIEFEQKPVMKVPTVATDQELKDIIEERSLNGAHRPRRNSLDPRRARALRRKMYLDLYSEVATKMLI